MLKNDVVTNNVSEQFYSNLGERDLMWDQRLEKMEFCCIFCINDYFHYKQVLICLGQNDNDHYTSMNNNCEHPDDLNTIRDELIREYFFGGYTNLEISAVLLLRHAVSISERQIRRILKKYGLKRKGYENEETVVTAIKDEISGSGSCLGYRAITRRLLSRHGLRVGRDRVYSLLKIIDPEGVNGRKHRRLSRRVYHNKGPNYLIHIDGYDKLKPYGFAIHGAICGYSRRILWLRVGRTNNDPEVIAGYFLEYLLEIGGVPRCIRADRGTENVVVENMQKSLRWYDSDDMASDKSFLYGASPTNQRIERWWLSARQNGAQYWMNLFKDLQSIGEISTENNIQKECLRFCYTNLIQKDLNQWRQDWNQHRIRQSNGAECPGGKPDLLFFTPELFDTVDYKTTVEIEVLDSFSQYCKFQGQNDFDNMCLEVLNRDGRVMPNNPDEAFELYLFLLQNIDVQ